MKRKKTTLQKLLSKRGETIAETLVALLISALALLMLAGAVSSAVSVVTKSKDKIAGYYEAENVVAEQSETSGTTGSSIKITIGEKSYTYPVEYYKNSELAKPVISYTSTGAPTSISSTP